jgi:hypothetical protein
MTILSLASAACAPSVIAQITPPPVPYISQPLVPSSAAPGSVPPTGALTITVNGTGFVPASIAGNGSVVLWNGSARPTTVLSSTKLTASITAEDVESPGTAWVTVFNPGKPSSTSSVIYFEIANPATSVSFSRTDYSAGTNPDAVAVGDFNGDGKLDLAVNDYGGNTVTILLGNGDGTFTPTATYPTGGGPQSIGSGDFNGDGRLDLAITNIQTNNITILLGKGDGTFAVGPQSPVVAAEAIGLAVGDFNGDGKLDLAVTSRLGNSVTILLGNGDGTFAAGQSLVAGFSAPVIVKAGDFNGDGNLDLAVSNSNGNYLTILLGNGDGTFTVTLTPAISSGSALDGLAVCDFNGDGKLDLAVGDVGTDSVEILLGRGDGTFKLATTIPLGSGFRPSELVSADFNGDGKLDLAVASVNFNNASIFLGSGDGTFAASASPTTGLNPDGLAVGDFNGDGRLDLAAATYNSNVVSILLQPTPSNGFAQLNGGNTFSGNQTVNGTVTATSFMGDGSGLVGVNALTAKTAFSLNCTGCVDSSQVRFPWAAGDAQGGNALNSLMLGGFSPSAFAPASGSGNYVQNGTTQQAASFSITGSGAIGNGLNVSGSPSTFASGLLADQFLIVNQNGVSSFPVLLRSNAGTQGGNNLGLMNESGSLAFQSCASGTFCTPTDTGLSIDPTGKITFVPGQTFSGTGTITGVGAGTGLSGGGSTGNVTLNLNTSYTDSRYLQLSGGTLTGSLSAPSFNGNGSGLTALNPANLNAGTAGINISGTAAAAVNAANASNAANAANANNLGGVAASNYARLDIGNNLNGNQSVAGNLSVSGNSATTGTVTIGGGTAITKHLSMTFGGSIAQNSCTTFSFPGAGDGDTVALGVPNSREAGGVIFYFAWVSAANTIRICDFIIRQGGPVSGSIRVDLWKH